MGKPGLPHRAPSGRIRAGIALGLAIASLAAASPSAAQSADSLPAFRSDSASADPFRKVEAGESPWAAPKPKADTGFRADTVTAKLTRRHPSLALWAGAEFSDLDAKEHFQNDLAGRLKASAAAGDTLQVLQPFEEAQLSFPVGVQAVIPLGPWFDAVGMARFSWYKQNAVLARTDLGKTNAGEAWYAVQSSLGGAGLRFYVPPALLSVTGSLGLYAQFLWLWNLGESELYTRYGSARARLDPAGAGFELLFGLQKALTGPWQLAGSLGFVKQDYASDRDWNALLPYAAPAGKVSWGSSSLQANLSLAYHFGARAADTSAVKPAARPPADSAGSGSSSTSVPSAQPGSPDQPAAAPGRSAPTPAMPAPGQTPAPATPAQTPRKP